MAVEFRITDFMRGGRLSGNAGVGTCGPDVTKPLAEVIQRIRSDFGRLTSFQKVSLCESAAIPPWSWDAWDILELNEYASNITKNGSVEVDGNCVGTSRANYIMFGAICHLCKFSESMTKLGAAMSKFFRLKPFDNETTEYTMLGYNGWPDGGVRVQHPGLGYFGRYRTGSGPLKSSAPWRYRWYPVFGDGFAKWMH
ncbi:MAG: hypothetical protein PHF70_08490 [Opitutales bacterium]|nr:hypothetical protein [Opitutales bacterium]